MPSVAAEIWAHVMSFLPLEVLWTSARPVSTTWNNIALAAARLMLYHGSRCEVSTLVNEMEGFQHYEGDLLYPISKEESEALHLSFARHANNNNNNNGTLMWLRQGTRLHEWTSFRSPENMWPNVIQYRSSGDIGFRLDYDFEFSPSNGDDVLFLRDMMEGNHIANRADWRIRIRRNHDGDETLAAVSIPLWQLVQLCLKGSAFRQDVERLPIGGNNGGNGGITSYYVWLEGDGEMGN